MNADKLYIIKALVGQLLRSKNMARMAGECYLPLTRGSTAPGGGVMGGYESPFFPATPSLPSSAMSCLVASPLLHGVRMTDDVLVSSSSESTRERLELRLPCIP